MSEAELVSAFKTAFERVEEYEKALELAKANMEQIKQALLDMFEANGTERTATYEGVGFITRSKPRLYASCNEENKQALFEELRATGRGDAIKEVVAPSTLSSWVSERIDAGQPVPEFISYVLKPGVRLYAK